MTAVPDPETVTFVVAGCQRCGTTWLDAALREHPEVYLPPQKQTYFFDRNYERGREWYLRQFEGAGPQHRAVGEVATGYCLPHAVDRLAALLPHVKVVMAMRHPVERAYSNYLVRREEMGWSSFEAALETDPDLIDLGRYADQIEGLLRHYDRGRCLFVLYDDLVADDRAYLRRILSFLGVDESFESSQFGRRRNTAMYSGLRRALHRAGLKPALRVLARTPVGDAVRAVNRRHGGSTARGLDGSTRARLVERFRPDNERLAALIGRDLSAWNE